MENFFLKVSNRNKINVVLKWHNLLTMNDCNCLLPTSLLPTTYTPSVY